MDARFFFGGVFVFYLNQREETSKCFVRRGLHVALCPPVCGRRKCHPSIFRLTRQGKGGVWEIAVQCENARRVRKKTQTAKPALCKRLGQGGHGARNQLDGIGAIQGRRLYVWFCSEALGCVRCDGWMGMASGDTKEGGKRARGRGREGETL